MFDFFQAIGDFFWFTFQGLVAAGNIPNIIISVVITILFIYWMGQIFKYGNK